jgi:hypothetical protein
MSGLQQRVVVGVRRFGDCLLRADVAADGVAVPGEHGAGQYASHSPVAVCKGVDDEKVENKQSRQKHGMVLARRNRLLVAVDEVVDSKRGARGRHRLEADSRRAVW